MRLPRWLESSNGSLSPCGVKIEQSGWATFAFMRFTFWKWEGAGNEFMLCDARDWPQRPTAEQIERWCSREEGIGTDGIIFFKPLTPPNASGQHEGWDMDFLNPDGSRSFCGNGSRALFAFLRDAGSIGNVGWFRACDGDHAVCWDESRGLPSVEMLPVQPPRKVEAMHPQGKEAWVADTGSPHHLEWIDATTSLESFPVVEAGRTIRLHKHYAPEGINVNFIEKRSEDGPNELHMRTYERGVEFETRGCGTGAVAAALSDHARMGGDHHRTIRMKGGALNVRFVPPSEKRTAYESVWLTGPAKLDFKGVWEANGTWKRLVLLLIWFGFAASFYAQNTPSSFPWSDQVQVSVLTGSPGQDAYSAWGHTAIRVYDPGHVPPVDVAYNYGTFQFSDGFYMRFLKGKLDYRLSLSQFASFQQGYFRNGRAIWEQPLDLSPSDARAVIAFLEWNHLPENRVYAYQFFSDNCSSRVLSVLAQVFGDRLDAGCQNDEALGQTYREAIRPYIQGDPWLEAGIDFILGPRADRVMPPCGSSFLPDGLMAQLPLCRLDGKAFVGLRQELVPAQQPWFRAVNTPSLVHPLFWMLVLGVWSLFWSLRRAIQFKRGEETPRWERVSGKLVLPLVSVLGLLLLLMWVATDHRDTWANGNLVWASPLLFVLWWSRQRMPRFHQWIHRFLVVGIPLFLIMSIFATQFVSLISAYAAWTVWLSLDPWLEWPHVFKQPVLPKSRSTSQ